ncbi:MAG: cation:proton antiporter [Muribaculaceae bacterium]|jgi:Kef-type K+ transport system membrane component KefB|uniref:cation:proton antiporter n=2 Tax=Duncaniella TaxID=2518495 RepID=UPI000F497411|nr:cation:proton antiporter [Duncaniella dubosii]MBJ2191681.1 cation:proton antiporter [Muribaculaceae bacterium]MCX4283226.1 cation:proton antiporter [Duncaniella dubosii]ROS89847.1 cation:proton antiporter [Muribaculaceae bacterium Isolate-080 (Janvier)]
MLLSLAIPATAPLITAPVPIFLTVMAIILLTPLVLSRLRIPHVIGLIVAGVVVGPHGFNLLARDMSFEVFGQVGILYLMFLAGIEIDMYHLRKNLRKGMTFGLFTFIIPLILGALVAMAALRMHFLEATLLASMFAAHTLIAYPIVTRFGVTKSPAVVIAIAGTIVTVLGSLIVLAGVLGVYRDGSVASLIPVLCYLALYCVGLIYIYPRVTRYFFKHYSDGIAQFIYVMVMVFGAAALASFIGLEGVFGAFFAGLVLNRFIPARSPLMGRLEFVGNAIFIPYFLIGVGMLIDLHVVMDGWTTLYTAAVMSAVAMLSKWIAAWVTQKVYRLTPVDRSIMYQLSNAHTAVALAVVMIGYEMHLFDVTVLNGTVVMILVTCTVSSFGTERAASRLKVQLLEQADEDSVRDDATTHPRTLVAISNPLTAPSIVDLALSMRFPDTSVAGDLYALHVRNDNSASSKAIGRNSLDVAERAASAVETNLTAIERFDLNFITGVLNTMEERDITELVLGIHRRTSIIDSFLGEKIEQLLRSTNRMVVMSRCFIPLATVTRILVAVPKKAQFETGFRRWVQAVGNLGRQVGCRVEFWCEDSTAPLIRTVITQSKLGIRMSFSTVASYDDFVIKSSEINDDDLLIVVSARRSSVSFDSDMDAVPEYLQKYLAGNNLIVIYPGQFGTEPPMTMAETMATDIVSPPNPVFLFAMNQLRRLRKMLRKASGRK